MCIYVYAWARERVLVYMCLSACVTQRVQARETEQERYNPVLLSV